MPLNGVDVLVVQGGPHTAVVRGRTGEPVVLLAGDLPGTLTPARTDALLGLASAVLTDEEMTLLRRCVTTLRRGGEHPTRRIEVDGTVLTVHHG